MQRLTIVTGLSGSGKSVALHTLEDEGFFCIDNLPSEHLSDLLDKLLASGSDLYGRLAIGIDTRSERASANGLLKLLDELRLRPETDVEVLFLDTDRTTLVTRFSETRRKHPLSTQDLPLINAIDDEARLLDPVKSTADLVIDTTSLNLHELREIVRTYLLGKTKHGLALVFQSFGFKFGTPASTDFMFDVRCLPNPHWEPDLRRFTGREKPIISFLENQPDVEQMYDDIRNFIARWLTLYEAENRSYLTISIGCTGGRHRSVYLAEKLWQHFNANRANVSLRHRELT
ncbi:MAG: RNase adapter RapZ [Granulosicoccus sp.]|nr:RNase adapter RapZ [Granulosicoccus sp.]